MNEIKNPRKKRPGKEFLTLAEYLSLARRMICRFASLSVRSMMLNDEDAVGYVAHMIMMGDWTYDRSKSVRISTWRGYNAKRSINKLMFKYRNAFRDGPEIVSDVDDSHNVVMMNKRPRSLDDKMVVRYAVQHKERDREDIDTLLSDLLGVLTDSQRKCVVMHHIDGLTPAQVARKLGISHQGVRQNLIRAMKVLRETASTHV